jgi:hypothetical protein
MSTLVYAYGCGQPIAGAAEAFAEVLRCRAMWDELVALDRSVAEREWDRAVADRPRLGYLKREIAEIEASDGKWPDALRERRKRLYGIMRRRFNAWRKRHREFLRGLNEERIEEVVSIRRRHTVESDDPIYWANSNRVLQSYETGRRVAALKGRLIRPFDPERDDGVLTVQIQRTRTGLGGAPAELMDGTFGHVALSAPDRRGQARLSMRVDAAGNHVELPIWLHRPLPEHARCKVAQLTYRRRADRLRWQLCLTLDVSGCGVHAPLRRASSGVLVEFDWLEQGYLEVMRAGGRIWRLPMPWMGRVDALEARQGALDDALNAARERWPEGPMAVLLGLRSWEDRVGQMARARGSLDQEQIDWWVRARRIWLALPGERAHILGARRELYRHWARELVSLYPAIVLPEKTLALYARKHRGEEENRWRHRACVHALRQEIEHQAAKAGTPILDASAQVVSVHKEVKPSSWARRKAGKALRAQAAQ